MPSCLAHDGTLLPASCIHTLLQFTVGERQRLSLGQCRYGKTGNAWKS